MSFFFNDAAPAEIYTLSLHDALPISRGSGSPVMAVLLGAQHLVSDRLGIAERAARDRKSTRLNSSHVEISYAVFCLKKKTKSGCATSTRWRWRPSFRLTTPRSGPRTG